MTAEAVIVELLGQPAGCPIRGIVADGTAIAKGALMIWKTDPRTLLKHAGVDESFAGIAATEKVASDGQLSIAVYTNGIFDITAAAAGVVAMGAMAAVSATPNMTTAADAADLLQNSHVGYVLESQANDEVSLIRILK